MKKSIKLTALCCLVFLLANLTLVACSKGGETEVSQGQTELATDAESKVEKPEDLANLKVAAQRGTVGQFIAEDLLADKAEANLLTFEKYADAIQALVQDKVQAVIMDEAPAKEFLKANDGLTTLAEPMSEENYAIGIKKDNAEMLAEVNKALAEIKQSGKLAEIIEKYNSDQDIDPKSIDYNMGAANGQLIVGTEAGFAPYELKVADGYIGIDIEMCAEIAKIMGKELVIKEMNFDSLAPALAAGQVDIICAGITVTDERKENMDFSEDYIESAKQVAVIKK